MESGKSKSHWNTDRNWRIRMNQSVKRKDDKINMMTENREGERKRVSVCV